MEADFEELLYYTNLKEEAATRFRMAFKLMSSRLQEKFEYLEGKCTYPSTWDQSELEDAVDRYQRAVDPCAAVDGIVAGEFYFLLSFYPILYGPYKQEN